MGLNLDEQKAVDRFKTNVVEPSMTKLVIVDFWAEWCGPCKQLTPVLEKVAAEYADKGVVLVKVNVDEEKFIASQFQVKSIPTVYAMFQGQPVADMTPARTEGQIKQMLDQILAQVPVQAGAEGDQPQQDVSQFIEMAEQVLADGDAARAVTIFAQVVEMAPDSVDAHAGLIRALIASGEAQQAQQIFDALMPEIQSDPGLAPAKSALELSANQVDDSELAALRDAANPEDMDASFAFAEAAFAAGQRDEAADALLSMIAKDIEWNDGAAKAKLLQIFEAVGLEDEWVVANRRKLSHILFG
ncbi:MAG: tetratricopeptide repeat protein [Altererythrobacter sp.]|nr:tetratricopeptide repeat protein [Altererythrobacter sp.]NNF94215.1 tetratricopeptide repeat protein [Altererythrobacter sp.]